MSRKSVEIQDLQRKMYRRQLMEALDRWRKCEESQVSRACDNDEWVGIQFLFAQAGVDLKKVIDKIEKGLS